jgi:site-specific recombinase XerD
MARIKFYLKGGEKAPANVPSPILISVSYQGVRGKIYIGETVEPRKWDFRYQRVKASATNSAAINDQLLVMKEQIEEIYHRLSAKGSVPSFGLLRAAYEEARNAKDRTPFVLAYFEQFIELQTGILKPNTVRNYRMAMNALRTYEAETRRKLTFEGMNVKSYEQIVNYFTRRNYARNTIGTLIKNLKGVLNHGFDHGLHENEDFRKFKVMKEEATNTYLDFQELEQLRELELSDNERLDRVRDLFLVGCWTGLRYSDFSRLTAENIEGDYIKIPTMKTGKTVEIPIHPVVREVLNKYGGNLPKSISNQKTNDYVKEICKLAGMDSPIMTTITKGTEKKTEFVPKYTQITSHTARRSFATNQYKLGCLSVVLMQITGHKTESSFLKYIKIGPEESRQHLADLWKEKMLQTAGGKFKVAN